MEIFSHSSGSWEVQDQGTSRFDVWRGFTSCFVDCYGFIFTLSSQSIIGEGDFQPPPPLFSRPLKSLSHLQDPLLEKERLSLDVLPLQSTRAYWASGCRRRQAPTSSFSSMDKTQYLLVLPWARPQVFSSPKLYRVRIFIPISEDGRVELKEAN